MTDSRSEEEQRRQRYVAAMGEELADVFIALDQDLQWVIIRWSQFGKLYGGTEGRLEVLNRAAPFFFWVIQQTLWEDVILAVTRMAAPLESMNKANLTIRRLPLLLDEPLRSTVNGHIKEIDDRLPVATLWRNRKLAHRDLNLALKRGPELPDGSVADIDGILDSMVKAMNAVTEMFFRSTTAYRQASLIHDADELVYVLRDGLRLEDQRQKRLEAGEYRPEDWQDEGPPL